MVDAVAEGGQVGLEGEVHPVAAAVVLEGDEEDRLRYLVTVAPELIRAIDAQRRDMIGAIDRLELHTERMEVSSEIIAETGRLQLPFVEIPIRPIYTEYSRGKGQTNLNSVSILAKLLIRRSL